jgi:DNA-3-methyladenine glycosylase I
VAAYDERKILALLADAGIVRNAQKVRAAVQNARAALEVQATFGSFDAYLWRFVDGKPIAHSWQVQADVPAWTLEAAAMSEDLRRRGFAFVGPTICYAFMQATGMVNDHLVTCFRHAQIGSR